MSVSDNISLYSDPKLASSDDCHHYIDKRIPFIPGEPHEIVHCDWCPQYVCTRCGRGLSPFDNDPSTYIHGVCTQTHAIIDNMRAREAEGRGRHYQIRPNENCNREVGLGVGCVSPIDVALPVSSQ
jgi:hypothetical protein